jgi:O-methyltransferase involved in polyketide biosynthesis
MARATSSQPGDLTVTALYTSQVWLWGGFRCAELFATDQARAVFRVTNAVLGLLRLFRRRLPSLRHSLAQRHALFDRALAESGARVVLELAAGLSERGARVSEDPATRYVEVDLPGVIATKRALLERSAEGRAVARRENLQLVAADLADLELPDLVDGRQSVCVIAEGIAMYLEAPAQRSLWSRVAALCARSPGSVFLFDLVPFVEQPRAGWLGRALGAAMRLFTRGRGFAFDARGRDALVEELRDCGFAEVELIEPQRLPDGWVLPFADVRTQCLLFRCR